MPPSGILKDINPKPMPTSPILATLQNSQPEERKNLLTQHIRKSLADFLELDDIEEVAPDQNFVALGTSSMDAVDFKSELESQLDCSLKTTLLFDYPQLDVLVDYLLTEVLLLSPGSSSTSGAVREETPEQPTKSEEPKVLAPTDEIVIVAMEGIFPGAGHAGKLWEKSLSGEGLWPSGEEASGRRHFGKIGSSYLPVMETLGITSEAYQNMDRQQQLVYAVISKAIDQYGISLRDLSSSGTGVFMGGQQITGKDGMEHDYGVPYQVPISNKVSFQLDLSGPSETLNTFCTSVYTAMHRAVQSMHMGECRQAIVGGVNVISEYEFGRTAEGGFYDELLSPDSCTRSFGENAQGFIRSEGAGVMILKNRSEAEKAGDRILAIIKSTAVHHGGRGFSLEAPNAKGIKTVIRHSIEKSGIDPDTIDYIEGHGIANPLADALELGAINDTYKSMSRQPDKQWHISTVKPTVGHPELASGMASLIKVIKALENKTIPGITGLDQVNAEVDPGHALILQGQPVPWQNGTYPRRVALNSYAIGGLNAHVILEEYRPGNKGQGNSDASREEEPFKVPEKDSSEQVGTPVLNPATEVVLSGLMKEVFGRELSELDLSQSPVHYGFDSIKVVQLVRRINECLDINLKMGQVLGMEDFRGFFGLLQTTMETQQKDGAKKERTDIVEKVGLSEGQKGLWFIQQALPETTSFNVPITLQVGKEISAESFQQAFTTMLEAHPVLRSAFQKQRDTDTLTVSLHPTESFAVIRETLETGGEAHVRFWELLRTPFDLATDPLVRLYLIEEKDSEVRHLFFVVHHILFDGLSGGIFVRDFLEQCRKWEAGTAVQTPAIDRAFFDFVQWERDYLASKEAEEDLAWWKERLAGISPSMPLPYDHRPSKEKTTVIIASEKLRLDRDTTAVLKQMAKTWNTNLSVVLLSLFKVFLHKLTQGEEITVTLPTAGRPEQQHEESIGFYINVIVQRSFIQPEATFEELVKEIRKNLTESLEHADYPFPKLISALGLSQMNAQGPVFPVAYVYQNIFDTLLDDPDAKAAFQTTDSVYQETDDNYTLEVYDLREELQVHLKYKQDLFTEATMKRHLAYFDRLVTEVIAHPKGEVRAYSLLSEKERSMILQGFNPATVDIPDTTVHELIMKQATAQPEATALIGGGETLTYGEVLQKSGQIALYLQGQGLQPDDLVGVCLERSPQAIIALLGVLRAGAAYLPMDVNHPLDRIRYVLKESEARLLMTSPQLKEGLEKAYGDLGCRLLDLEGDWGEISTARGSIAQKVRADNLAYVIYTSGSTGQPKGVMIPHRALLNYVLGFIDYFQLQATDRFIHGAALTFDISIEEIFPILTCGGTLVVSGQGYLDVRAFEKELMEHRVTAASTVPVVVEQLDKAVLQAGYLRLLISGGDVLPPDILDSFPSHVKVYNTYGPTEATVCASYYPITPHSAALDRLPIGKPVRNAQLYILDKHLQVLPIGVVGELHIAGAGLSTGYLDRPALTAEKFIDNPYGPGRLYKTGDLARWQIEGMVEYMGRADHQVKVRGFRVELGEIENRLLTHAQIENAVVVLQKDLLIAFYTTTGQVTTKDLRDFLSEQVPGYMVPAIFEQLDALPMMPNGKVNRKDLGKRKVKMTSQSTYVAPRSELETGLAEIWQEVLNVKQVGIHDNFFELGGHSLISVQVVGKVSERFGQVSIQVMDLLQNPTIASLAQTLVLKQDQGEEKLSPYIVRLRDGDRENMSFMVPGMPGLVDGYHEMATYLPGEGVIYGLQMKGFMGEVPYSSLEGMAAHNIEQVKLLAPKRAISLYAHSYGGNVVYEMLRQLSDTDIEVERVVFVECPILRKVTEISKENVHVFYDAIINYLGIDPDLFYEKIYGMFDLPPDQWKDLILEAIYASEMRVDRTIFTNIWKLLDKSLQVDYELKEKLPYDLQLIITEENSYLSLPHENTWEDFFTTVREVSVSGDHLTVVRRPYCIEWARKLT